jgi:hypothetical protein
MLEEGLGRLKAAHEVPEQLYADYPEQLEWTGSGGS